MKMRNEKHSEVIPEERQFYLVASNLRDAPIRNYMFHGYNNEDDFYDALHRLIDRWRGRIGESIGERHGFLLLRFHDTPGGKPDEAWLPRYLLKQTAMPEYLREEQKDEAEIELDRAFGFD